MDSIEKLTTRIIRHNGSTPIHNCILHIKDTEKNIKYIRGFGKMDHAGSPVNADYNFRVGSITKTFTATIIMQLMEEGLLSIDDFFLNHLSNKEKLKGLIIFKGVDYSDQLTIKNLLQHRSGIRDYFADEKKFFDYIVKFPSKNWSWKGVLEKYFAYDLNKKGICPPGKKFYYSDTNYLLLAILIEEITKNPFHEELEKRILTPLCLNNTYLEFFQEPKNESPIIFPFFGSKNLKDINTSFDWGGGGLISSLGDLDVFIRALLSEKLFNKKETLKLMASFNEKNQIDKNDNTCYAIGLQKMKIDKYTFIGHKSAYGSMMFYDKSLGLSIIFSINQASTPHKAEWLLKKLVENFTS